MRYAIFTLCAVLIFSCRTTPEAIPDDITPSEIFQKAQEAVVERNDYVTALRYYELFLDRFPDDVQKAVEAEYEIAFIQYKLQDFEAAKTGFTDLLAKYDAEGFELLPQWPRILSEKVLNRIETAESAAVAESATAAE